MLATSLVAVAMAMCLGVAALAQGNEPTRARVLGTTLAGIAAATVSRMLVSTVVTVPESGDLALFLFLLILSVGLVRSGVRGSTPGAA